MNKIKIKRATLSCDGTIKYIDTEATLIKIKGLEFAHYKDELYKKNFVIDIETGLSVNTINFKTKKDAVEEAESKFDIYLDFTKTDKYKELVNEYKRNK